MIPLTEEAVVRHMVRAGEASSFLGVPAEVSYMAGLPEEVFYNRDDPSLSKHLLDVYNYFKNKYFQDIAETRVKAFSFQVGDGTVYDESKFMLFVDGARQDCFMYPELFCFNPWPEYCLNVGVCTGRRSVKFYAMDYADDLDIPIPPNAGWAKAYGVGVRAESDVVGIYVSTTNYHELVKFYKVADPLTESGYRKLANGKENFLFGLTYNTSTREVLKLVYYNYHAENHEQILARSSLVTHEQIISDDNHLTIGPANAYNVRQHKDAEFVLQRKLPL